MRLRVCGGRCSLLAVLIAIILTLGGATVALAGGPQALTVLPPGNGDTVTLSDYLANQAEGGCGGLGPHSCDQLSLYANWGFHGAPLAQSPADVIGAASSEQPEPGLTIVHDNVGVPHVFAAAADPQAINERLAFGVGYAQAEDRLFQMEILRRAGEGTLSDLLGPSYLQMDLITSRDFETAADRAAQTATLTEADQQDLAAYSEGINAVIARDEQHPAQLPAGFTLLQDTPIRPWSAGDTVAIIDLEARDISVSSGDEVGYGALARSLAGRYGVKRAARILNDIQLTNDPRTPLSIPHDQRARSSTDRLHYSFIQYTPHDTAARIAALDSSVGPAQQAMLNGQAVQARAIRRLGLPVFGSNAWAIAPRRSTTHHPLLYGSPQVGYYVPEVLDELEIEGGSYHVRGVGVPGAGPGVVIGYTPHTAWSITDAQDDQIDTYVDRIRTNPSGSGYQYLWRGTWHPVTQRTETIRERTFSPSLPLTGPVPTPTYISQTVTFYSTFHGRGAAALPCQVFYFDAADHRSYCHVDAFWNREIRSGLAVTNADQAQSLPSFQRAIRGGVAGFNFIYADDRGNIAYWHTGTIPIRERGHDPRLPAPGNGRFDWRGFVSPSRWPSVIDPAQGFIASWNNKPQASWPASGDGVLWGTIQRVGEPMRLLAQHRGGFTPTALWNVGERTGELDLRDTLGFKPFLTRLRALRLRPIERQAIAQVVAWNGVAFYPAGAEHAPDGTLTGNVAAPGFAIFEAWYHALEARLGAPVFEPVLAKGNVASQIQGFTLTPGTTNPEYQFFNDYDEFVYDVMSGHARGAKYFGRGSARSVSRAALDEAIAALSASQGPDPSRWRAAMPQTNFFALDVANVPSIPFENRGTWAQAVTLP